MYEYRVVPVGDVRALRRHPNREVVEAGDTTDEAMQAALDDFASRGWKLHTALPSGRGTMLIFERLSPESAKRIMEAMTP